MAVGNAIGIPFTKSNILMENMIIGLLDFDGINDSIEFDSTPDSTGNKTLTFNLYLTKESGYPSSSLGAPIIVFASNSEDYVSAFLKGDQLIIYTTNLGFGNKTYSLSGLSSQVLNVKIVKQTGSSATLYINDVLQTPSSTLGGAGMTSSKIGWITDDFLTDAYVWDVILANTGGANIHYFKGYPNGNTEEAWDDLIGSIQATVYGNPTTINLPV